jgi:predicted ferric reductase
MKQRLWIALYFLLIFAPLLILLLAPRPAGALSGGELSVALGFAVLALMGFQFIPTARCCRAAERSLPTRHALRIPPPLSNAAFVLSLAHPVILFIQNPTPAVAESLHGALACARRGYWAPCC